MTEKIKNMILSAAGFVRNRWLRILIFSAGALITVLSVPAALETGRFLNMRIPAYLACGVFMAFSGKLFFLSMSRKGEDRLTPAVLSLAAVLLLSGLAASAADRSAGYGRIPAFLSGIFPDSGLVIRSGARLEWQAGRREKAEDMLRKAIKKSSADKKLVKDLARMLYTGGSFKEAEALFARLSAEDPEDTETALAYANTLIINGDKEKGKQTALAALRRQEKQKPSALTYLQLRNFSLADGDKTKAAEYLKKAVKKNPDDTLVMLEQAGDLADSGAADAAEKLYKKVLVKEPANLDAAMGLGALYFNGKRYDDAIETYSNAAVFFPNSAKLYCNIGMCFFIRGMNDQALQMFIIALKLDPQTEKAAQAFRTITGKEYKAENPEEKDNKDENANGSVAGKKAMSEEKARES